MMKRKFIYIVVIIVSLFFMSCKGKDRQVTEEDRVTIAPTATTELTPTPDAAEVTKSPVDNPGSKDGTNTSYQITEASYVKGEDINIRYPQLTGLTDKIQQDKINELIKKDAMKDVEEFETAKGTLEVKYEVSFQGENLLSIKYIEYSFYPGAAHPSKNFFTTNINLKDASRVKLKDVVKISDYFVTKFKTDSKYTDPIRNADQELETLLEDDINALNAEGLMEADSPSAYTPYYSYFTGDSLGIGLEVPFVVGGYALYEITYADILSYILYENEIWLDFPELLSQLELSGNGETGDNPGDQDISIEGIPFKANRPEEFIPTGYHLCEAFSEQAMEQGDLNQDGISDLALVIEGDTGSENSAQRILIIAFGKEDGTYSTSVIARTAILRSDEGGIWGDPFEGITIKKGSIYLSFYGGSAWRWGNNYQFRYQDGDWYLIGATESFINVGNNVGTEKDYNLLTGDYIITDYVEDGTIKVTKGNFNKRNRYRLETFDTGNEDIFNFETVPSAHAYQPSDNTTVVPVAVEGILLGGYNGREWIDTDGIVSMLNGGETYQLFSGHEFVGTAKGKVPELDIDFGSFYHLDMKKDDKYDIAVGSEAEIPCLKPGKTQDSYYENIIKQFFKEIDHPEYQIGHLEGASFDLDQDGDQEDIICVYQYPESAYYQLKAENNYSYTLLHDNGKTIIIDEAYRDIAAESGEYGMEIEKGEEIIILYMTSVLGSVDINNDGIYEVIIEESWFEGWGYSVYEYQNGSLKKVLGVGFGI